MTHAQDLTAYALGCLTGGLWGFVLALAAKNREWRRRGRLTAMMEAVRDKIVAVMQADHKAQIARIVPTVLGRTIRKGRAFWIRVR